MKLIFLSKRLSSYLTKINPFRLCNFSRVVLLDEGLAQQLFGTENPLESGGLGITIIASLVFSIQMQEHFLTELPQVEVPSDGQYTTRL